MLLAGSVSARPPAEAPMATTGNESRGGTNGAFDRSVVRGATLPICVRYLPDLRAVGAFAIAGENLQVFPKGIPLGNSRAAFSQRHSGNEESKMACFFLFPCRKQERQSTLRHYPSG